MANQKSNVKWTIVATVIAALVQMIQLMVAARFLSPYEFGALAIINVLNWIVIEIQSLGLNSYCIHIGEANRKTHSTLFWVSSALGFVGCAIAGGFAIPLAHFYEIPELKPLIALMAANFLLLGVSAQYQANLIRVFKADALAKLEVVARVFATLFVLLGLSHYQWGLTAIVVGTLLFSVLQLVGLIWLAERHWHPLFSFDRQVARAALSYGGFHALSQVLNQLRAQADQLIVGKALGPELLGIYTLAKELIRYPMRVIKPVLARVVLPAMARDQYEPEKLNNSVLDSTRKTAVLSAAVFIGLAIFAPWVVTILYGEYYLAVAGLVPLMALFGTLKTFTSITGLAAQAVGNTRLNFYWQLLCFPLTVPLFVVLAYFDAELIHYAAALSIVQLLVTVASYPLLLKHSAAVGFVPYIRTWAVPALACICLWFIAPYIQLPEIGGLGRDLFSWVYESDMLHESQKGL